MKRTFLNALLTMIMLTLVTGVFLLAEWKGDTLVVIREQERETPRGTMQIREEQHWALS